MEQGTQWVKDFELGEPALVCRWRIAGGRLPLENRHLRALGARNYDCAVVAIGGVNAATMPRLSELNVDGAAVVSAIFAADDIEAATRELSRIIDETLGI